MWVYNSDFKKWYANNDSISKFDFDLLKQELKATRYYSRILSGATYLPVNDLTDIYDILGDYEQRDWYISTDVTNGSVYSVTSVPPQHATPIDKNSSYEYYAKYVSEYGLTLKNLFTPERLIKDSSKNFYQVDVATTETIDLNAITKNFTIDGVLLKEGHRVLVKNQATNIVLLSTADPSTYFQGRYTIVQDLGATIEYQYYNQENGIYKYTNGNLVRETDLDYYNQCIRYSVLVKLGTNNANKQFHLSRLLSGYYPTTYLQEPIEFREKHNWILRNRVDYNNLFEINYYDVIKHGTQSYNYEGTTYSIPERTISIGEFGVILNTQEGKSNVIKNKYKVNLRSISETTKYYWMCGDENTLLRVRKHDFYIDRIVTENIPTTLAHLIKTNLTSVSFFDDLNGAVVGELNTILYTRNGGLDWSRLEIIDFQEFNYNKVLFSTNSSFYVAGNTGVLIEFIYSISGWTAYKRRVSKVEDNVDEYLLVENINDMYKTSISTWSTSYNYFTQSIGTNKDLLFLVTNNNNIIAYDVNNSFSQLSNDFIYFDFGKNYGDIRNIVRKKGTNKFYFTGVDPVSGNDGIFSFDISNFSTIGTGSSYSNTSVGSNVTFEYTKYVNQLFDYNANQMLICGNNSILGVSTYSTSFNFVSPDSTFEDKLKSKMLFVDYDIASKLNFFTDQGDYRLPTAITFSSSLTASGSKISFQPIQHGYTATNGGTYSEVNWIEYFRDSQKTFEYYSNAPLDESTKVLMSITFSYTSISTTYTYTNTQLTASASAISNLAPMITYATASRYDGTFLPAITAPTTSFSIFLYDYLMVYKVPNNYVVSVGDVLLFDSSVVSTKLVVNKIVTPTPGLDKYLYCFTEFNGNILTELEKTTNSIIITNLNRYSDLGQLMQRFNTHPISDGYSLDFVNQYGQVTTTTTSVLQITPKFNEKTAYYNLQYRGNINSQSLSTTYNNTYYFGGGTNFLQGNTTSYFNGGHTNGNVPASTGNLLTMASLPPDGSQFVMILDGNIFSFTFKNSPVGPTDVQIDSFPGYQIQNTLNNLKTAIISGLSSYLILPYLDSSMGYCNVANSGSQWYIEIFANKTYGAVANSNPGVWEIQKSPFSYWLPNTLSTYFNGGLTDPIINTGASVSKTLTILPSDGDTFKIYNGTLYTFTFKNVALPLPNTTEVQIGASINATLNNLISKIYASGLMTPTPYLLPSGSFVTGNTINLKIQPTYGATPNNSWYINFVITTSTANKAYVTGTMSILPQDGDTFNVYTGSTYSFTFKNSPTTPYHIQIATASIPNTLVNLKTTVLALPALSASVNGGFSNITQFGLTASSGGSTPNSNWRVNLNLSSTTSPITISYDAVYTDSFLKFGYSPTYNLLDYLQGLNSINDINPKFYATKEYLAMPIYKGLPLGSLTASTVYIDYNGMTYSGGSYSLPVNKILFGTDLKLEWDSIFLNTFVDVEVDGTHNYKTEKLLVTNKYYDSINNAYVVEFHKRILPNSSLNQNILSGCTLNIISRRTLKQISEDLQILNNIQRTKGKTVSIAPKTNPSRQLYSYSSYQNELNFKMSTDSYAKILLSDSDTVQQLSAIVYIDYKNELAMNITKLAKEYNVPIVNTINYGGKLYISCSEKHDLVTGEGVVLDFIGGTGSSQQLNPQYSGYHVVTKINDTDFVTSVDYGVLPTVGVDSGYVRYTKQDPFLNYQPVDLIDLGVDKKGKVAIELSIDNLKLTSAVYSLVNVDFEKYRFRLIDGLNVETLSLQYPWIFEAEISDALLGITPTSGLVWYQGTWLFGRWFGGTWHSGVWMSGDWYGGTWNSNIVTDKKISADVDTKTIDINQSIWLNGRWYDGTWNNGIWNNGRWYGGTWNSGMWHNGTWNDGTWNKGNFEGGIWVLGTWNTGVFNCNTQPAYWLDGNWNGGDFENGMWYNGYWQQKNGLSRFGTKSFNSRTANWQSGTWVSGSFYSHLNYNDQNVLDVCDVHKYSIWKTGQWLSGEWYGGIAYNMDFKTGTWYGGILEDIEVIGIDSVNNTFTLNGIFKFNIGDVISIVDNQLSNANSVYGSDSNPISYTILYHTEDSVNKRTIIYVDTNLIGPSVTTVTDTGLRVVSRFKNINWKSGIWTNGIFETGLWEGGIWYNGIFSGTWA